MNTTSIVILAAGTALIVGSTVIWYRRHSLSNTRTPTIDPISHPSPPSQEQCSFVQQRVEAYRDEMLRYELGLEYYRRQASQAVLQKLLAGKEEVLAKPVLDLISDEWSWGPQQLQKAVEAALQKLGLPVLPDISRPTMQAKRACEQWATAEAKRQFDTLLGTDTQS